MPAANIGGWIRIGVWALPVYGLLTFWATFTHEPDRQNEVEAYARYISTTSYLAQHLLGSILGAILAIFGVMALAAYLANRRVGRWALLAMVLSVAGNCLILTIFGFSTHVSPVIGRLYLEGQPGAMEVNEAIFGTSSFAIVAVLGLLLYLSGAILLGVAIWRSGVLPKWAGALYAPTGLLIASGVAIGWAQTVGSALLIVAGGWIAWSLMRQPSSQLGTEVQPRVQ
jgi:drug/metabolite transporter (DMT)-like permease